MYAINKAIKQELIETLWNVNYFKDKAINDITGINRNIVECKYSHTGIIQSKKCELIETLWNVNLLTGQSFFQVNEN